MTSNKRQKMSQSLTLSLEPSTSTNTNSNQDQDQDSSNSNFNINPNNPSLSQRLSNLWAQRGDFSDFNADKLRQNLLNEKEDKDGNPQKNNKKKKDEIDFQIPEDSIPLQDNQSQDSNLEGRKGKKKREEEEEKDQEDESKSNNLSSSNQIIRDTITSNQMLNLRTQMLTSLNQAHSDIFFLSSLLTYVSNFTKPSNNTNQSTNSNNNNLNLPPRAASPSSTSIGNKKNQSRGGGGGGGGSINDQSNHASSSQQLQTPAEELGLDPNGIGLSLVTNENDAKKSKEQKNQEDDDEDEEDEDEEIREIKGLKNLTIKEKVRENTLILSKKRNSLVNSIEILENGAKTLDPNSLLNGNREIDSTTVFEEEEDEENQLNPNQSNKGPDSNSNVRKNPENERFEILKRLKSNGWGVNPSKAQLPKDVFGMSLEIGGQIANNDDASLNGSRDCLIGWGVPEALSHFRTQSFAYVDTSTSSAISSSTSKLKSNSKLIFPRRQYRRLRVVFIVKRNEIVDGKQRSLEEKFGSFVQDLDEKEVEGKKSNENLNENQDVEMKDSDDQNQKKKEIGNKAVDLDLDLELKKAQKEMIDEELFSELVGQYRRIETKLGLEDDFFGIHDSKNGKVKRSKQNENTENPSSSSFEPKTKLSAHHLRFPLNSKVELRFEMVPTGSNLDSNSEKTIKAKSKMNEITNMKDENYHHSFIADLIRVYFEMEMIRRYRSKAGIENTFDKKNNVNDWKKMGNSSNERNNRESHSLEGLIMMIKYFTFTNQLQDILSNIISTYHPISKEASQNGSKKSRNDQEIELSWDPISNITDLGNWVESLLLGRSEDGLIEIINSLGGSATIWRRNVPIAVLSFSSSSNLSLQLPTPFKPSSISSNSKKTLTSKSDGKENQDGQKAGNESQGNGKTERDREGLKDGKGRVINGLNLKQLELFLKKALMED